MASDDLQGVPLSELFRRAAALVEGFDSRPSNALETRAGLQEGLHLLRLAAQLVDSTGLFSPNEDKDDIATSDLRYLLIPFYHGELLSQANPGNPAAKRGMLGSAVEQYMAYLHRARQYDLLEAECTAMLAQLEESEQGGEGSSGSGGGRGGGAGKGPAQLRQNKILKSKRERAIKARLEALQQQAGEEGGRRGEDHRDDDDAREAWLLKLDLAGLKAAEQVSTLRQEMEILAHAAALPEEEREKPRAPPPPELKQKLLEAASALQAGLQGGERERLRAGVFRPSHTLPTMTVQQWGELEMQDAMERQRAEQERERAEQAKRAGQRSDEEDEEELRKQRAWDNFKDDNPRGWGNKRGNVS